MDREYLAPRLADKFSGSPGQHRAVARAASDLADAGTYRTDMEVALTPDLVCSELADAPDEMDVVERWNWWIESLEYAHGGYTQFLVTRWTDSTNHA